MQKQVIKEQKVCNHRLSCLANTWGLAGSWGTATDWELPADYPPAPLPFKDKDKGKDKNTKTKKDQQRGTNKDKTSQELRKLPFTIYCQLDLYLKAELKFLEIMVLFLGALQQVVTIKLHG